MFARLLKKLKEPQSVKQTYVKQKYALVIQVAKR